jgi:hypothetical protein
VAWDGSRHHIRGDAEKKIAAQNSVTQIFVRLHKKCVRIAKENRIRRKPLRAIVDDRELGFKNPARFDICNCMESNLAVRHLRQRAVSLRRVSMQMDELLAIAPGKRGEHGVTRLRVQRVVCSSRKIHKTQDRHAPSIADCRIQPWPANQKRAGNRPRHG